MPGTLKMRFLDVFNEDKDEALTLKVNLQINDEEPVPSGETFRKGEKIGGIDFHILRYFDFAAEPVDEKANTYKLTGFFPQK